MRTTKTQTAYVGTKSELTEKIKELAIRDGFEYYRTRLNCSCAKDFRRYGALITNGEKVVAKVVKCKACLKQANETKPAKLFWRLKFWGNE